MENIANIANSVKTVYNKVSNLILKKSIQADNYMHGLVPVVMAQDGTDTTIVPPESISQVISQEDGSGKGLLYTATAAVIAGGGVLLNGFHTRNEYNNMSEEEQMSKPKHRRDKGTGKIVVGGLLTAAGLTGLIYTLIK